MTQEQEMDFDLKEWTARFREIVDLDGHARTGWQALTGAGVDPQQLSSLLAFACDFDGSPASRLIEQVRMVALQEAKDASKLADRLQADCTELQEYRSELPDGLLEKLSEATDRLRSSAKEVQGVFSKHKVNPNFFLVLLINHVREITGSPRYREISLLLECAHVAFRQDIPLISEESLRKTYGRFMKDNPFRNLVSPEGRRNMLFALFILFIVQVIASGDFSKFSKPAESADESGTAESLRPEFLTSPIEEILRKPENKD
jgi:hypothetical protein